MTDATKDDVTEEIKNETEEETSEETDQTTCCGSCTGSSDSSKSPIWQKFLCIAKFKIMVLEKFISPIILLLLRIHIGLVFWKSGQTKIANLDNTKSLFEWEYIPNWETNATKSILGMEITFPTPDAELMATMATYSEVTLPVLLIAGLAGRVSAFGIFMMALTIELFIYPGTSEHIYWMLCAAVLVTQGPGFISVDYWIRRHFLKSK